MVASGSMDSPVKLHTADNIGGGYIDPGIPNKQDACSNEVVLIKQDPRGKTLFFVGISVSKPISIHLHNWHVSMSASCMPPPPTHRRRGNPCRMPAIQNSPDQLMKSNKREKCVEKCQSLHRCPSRRDQEGEEQQEGKMRRAVQMDGLGWAGRVLTAAILTSACSFEQGFANDCHAFCRSGNCINIWMSMQPKMCGRVSRGCLQLEVLDFA